MAHDCRGMTGRCTWCAPRLLLCGAIAAATRVRAARQAAAQAAPWHVAHGHYVLGRHSSRIKRSPTDVDCGMNDAHHRLGAAAAFRLFCRQRAAIPVERARAFSPTLLLTRIAQRRLHHLSHLYLSSPPHTCYILPWNKFGPSPIFFTVRWPNGYLTAPHIGVSSLRRLR